jgi:hypothetical protein
VAVRGLRGLFVNIYIAVSLKAFKIFKTKRLKSKSFFKNEKNKQVLASNILTWGGTTAPSSRE